MDGWRSGTLSEQVPSLSDIWFEYNQLRAVSFTVTLHHMHFSFPSILVSLFFFTASFSFFGLTVPPWPDPLYQCFLNCEIQSISPWWNQFSRPRPAVFKINYNRVFQGAWLWQEDYCFRNSGFNPWQCPGSWWKISFFTKSSNSMCCLPPLVVFGVVEVVGRLQGEADQEAGHQGAWALGLALSLCHHVHYVTPFCLSVK